MKKPILEVLSCPACLPEESELALKSSGVSGNDVLYGELKCQKCKRVFPIKDGIAYLLPESVMKMGSMQRRYESAKMLFSYLWSHYADIMGDEEATDAYGRWASCVPEVSGFALDAGCAVGRFTFELARKCDFAIGFDYSRSFVNAARRLLVERRMEFTLVEEGKIAKTREITLPDNWDSERVEFIVADAMKLPFKKGTFSLVSTLNLVDKLARPLDHLVEINRVAKTKNAWLLFSDPFSWSTEVCPEEYWLGGTEEGRFQGYGLENVKKIITGEYSYIAPGWIIETEGSVWWKIRNHRNHFELIRSLFIRASR